MEPFRKREKKHISDFLEHVEGSVAVTGTKGKVLTGQALGNTSSAVSRRQAERTAEPAGTGSVCWFPRGGKAGSKALAPARHRTPQQIGNKSTALHRQHQRLPEKVNVFSLSALGRFLLTWFNWVLALGKALERDNLCSVTKEL